MALKTINYGKRLEGMMILNRTRGVTMTTLHDRLSDIKVRMGKIRKELDELNIKSQHIDDIELQKLQYIYQNGSLDDFTPKDIFYYEREIDKLKIKNDSLLLNQTSVSKKIAEVKDEIDKTNKNINDLKKLKLRINSLISLDKDQGSKTTKEWRVYSYDVTPEEETIEVQTFHWHKQGFVCNMTFHTYSRKTTPKLGKWNKVRRNGLLNKVSTIKDKDLNELLYFYETTKDHELSS